MYPKFNIHVILIKKYVRGQPLSSNADFRNFNFDYLKTYFSIIYFKAFNLTEYKYTY